MVSTARYSFSTSYSFDDFRHDILTRVRLLNRRLTDPDDVWPGVLILDAPDGLSADRFELPAAGRARAHLFEVDLPALIITRRARRFCWVMPVARRANDAREYLLLLIAERGHCEAALAQVKRDGVTALAWHPGPPGRLAAAHER